MQVSITGLVLLGATGISFVGFLRLLGVKKWGCPLLNVEFHPRQQKPPKPPKPPKGRGCRGDTG